MRQFGTKVRAILAGAVVGAATLAASAASASTLILLSATMNTAYTAQVQGPAAPFTGAGENAYEGPLTFQVSDAAHANPYALTAFCVDLFDDINLGNLNLTYETWTLGTNRDTGNQHLGTALSATTLSRMTKLLTLANTFETNMAANGAQLAAIQGAIWQIENPGYTVTSHNAGVDAFMNSYIARTLITDPNAAGFIREGQLKTIISLNTRNQAFAFAAGVPEPSSWGLMIMGFGAIGATLRRRRTAAVAA